MPGRLNLTNRRFGRLTALSLIRERHKSGRTWLYWHCRCDCGATTDVRANQLSSGHTRSCGCLAVETRITAERSTTHGLSKTRAWLSYKEAKRRCTNPNAPKFHLYGGRGIEFRLPPFIKFFAIMGERPPGHELDRINPDGHYETGNIRWWPKGRGVRRLRR